MSEGTAGHRLKRAIYARMEEMSFRSAVATAAAVLAITGLGIALTVTSGGGHRRRRRAACGAPRVPPRVGSPAAVGLGGALAAGRALAQPAGQPRRKPVPAATQAPQPPDDAGARIVPHASPVASSSPWPTPRRFRLVVPRAVPARGDRRGSALPAARVGWWPGAP